MRKYIIVSIAAMMYAPQAFAAAPATDGSLKGFNATKNVTINYTLGCSPATGTGSQCWGAASSHMSGDKQFWSSSAYGGLAFQTVTPGSSISAPTAPATPTDSAIKDSAFSQM